MPVDNIYKIPLAYESQHVFDIIADHFGLPNAIGDMSRFEKIEKYNEDFDTFSKAFGCYELFHEKYKSIKLTDDLEDDKSNINLIFPSIKDKLFNLVICNNRTMKPH